MLKCFSNVTKVFRHFRKALVSQCHLLIRLFKKVEIFPRHENTGMAFSGVSLTSWKEGASLALVGHPSSDDVTIKMPYGVDVLLRQPASHVKIPIELVKNEFDFIVI